MRWLAGLVVVVAAVVVFPGGGGDSLADWVTVQAVVDGHDPHAPISELFDRYRIGRPDYQFRQPRLPGALLLMMPYALVPQGWVEPFGKVIAVAPVVVAWILFRPRWVALLLIFPMTTGIYEGNASSVVTLLVGLAVWRGSGVALGAATLLRGWPWYLGLVFVVTGRWKAAAVSGVTFFGLNAVGLMLPGVTVEGTTAALREGMATIVPVGWNMAPSLWVSAPVAVGFLVLVWYRPEVFPYGVVPALVLSPVVWSHYLTVLMVPLGKGKAPRPSEKESRGASEQPPVTRYEA